MIDGMAEFIDPVSLHEITDNHVKNWNEGFYAHDEAESQAMIGRIKF